MKNLKALFKQYGIWKEVGGTILSPIIDSDVYKREIFNFKLQWTLDWSDKTFKDFWVMVTWNEALQVKYCNILDLTEIARCQCVNTIICEKIFLVLNVI